MGCGWKSSPNTKENDMPDNNKVYRVRILLEHMRPVADGKLFYPQLTSECKPFLGLYEDARLVFDQSIETANDEAEAIHKAKED